MTLSHRLQRDLCTVLESSSPGELMAVGSAAIEPWDQYIGAEDAQKHPPPVCAWKNVWTSLYASVCSFICSLRARISVCAFFSAYYRSRRFRHRQIKTLTFPNAHFSHVGVFQGETANHYLFAFLFLLFFPSRVLCGRFAGLISKQKVLSGYTDW